MPSLAVANVLHRKGRTAISIAAVAVGVMTSLVLTGLTQGSIHEVVQRMQNVDADLAVHARGWSLVLDSGWPLPMSAREKLLAVPGVAYATPIAATRFGSTSGLVARNSAARRSSCAISPAKEVPRWNRLLASACWPS